MGPGSNTRATRRPRRAEAPSQRRVAVSHPEKQGALECRCQHTGQRGPAACPAVARGKTHPVEGKGTCSMQRDGNLSLLGPAGAGLSTVQQNP